MDEKQKTERKKYLALQVFYLKVKEAMAVFEEKLEIDAEHQRGTVNDFQARAKTKNCN